MWFIWYFLIHPVRESCEDCQINCALLLSHLYCKHMFPSIQYITEICQFKIPPIALLPNIRFTNNFTYM